MLKIRGMDIYYVRGDDDSFTIQPVTERQPGVVCHTCKVHQTSHLASKPQRDQVHG